MKAAYIQDREQWKKGFSFYCPITVRFSETDLFGHLNNCTAFVYFEQARIEYLKAIGFMADWMSPDSDTIPVVADLQCDYAKQVYFDQSLKVFVKVDSVGTSSMDIHYMVVNDREEIVMTGRSTMVQLSRKSGRGTPWTEQQKEFLLSPVV